MNVEELRALALSYRAVEESFPFDADTLVFKVLGKIFLMVALEKTPVFFNFKALPENGIRYRELYPAVSPGYHSNKKHWNSLILDGSVPDETIRQMVKDSYDLIVKTLPKYKQSELKEDESNH